MVHPEPMSGIINDYNEPTKHRHELPRDRGGLMENDIKMF